MAGEVTVNGNIYNRDVLARAIEDFNNRAPVEGGLLNRERIGEKGQTTHVCRSMFLNDSGVLCANVQVTDPDLRARLTGDNPPAVVARPVLSIPSYIKENQTVDMIYKIIRVQIEVDANAQPK